MGDGFVGPGAVAAGNIVESLNGMFSQDNVKALAAKVQVLGSVYPGLLKYNAKQTDGRKKRQSSLRFAAWLLTSDIRFTVGTLPYPAKQFVKWLKWTRWIDNSDHKTIPVAITEDFTVPAKPTTDAPAKAIIDTLVLALADPPNEVHFEWAEEADTTKTQIEIMRDANKSPWIIKVTSPKEPDIKNVDDGDDFTD